MIESEPVILRRLVVSVFWMLMKLYENPQTLIPRIFLVLVISFMMIMKRYATTSASKKIHVVNF